MNTTRVELGPHSYDIVSGNGLLAQLPQYLTELQLSKQTVIIADQNVAQTYGESLQSTLTGQGYSSALLTIPPGEVSKNLDQVKQLYDQLLELKADRQTIIIALGGGVTGDLVGFVAATYMRGVPLIHVPTSLLAMVDSSIGGKVGVNLAQGKNLVGAFYQPKLVLCDLDTLQTLPPNELVNGMAEVLKYGASMDPALFSLLETEKDNLLALEPQVIEQVVNQCALLKSRIVAQDEKESGVRMYLNFGHTLGHAIEALSNYQTHTHGQAVAIGMNAAARISVAMGMLDQPSVDRLEKVIQSYGLPTKMPKELDTNQLIEQLQKDKKVVQGNVRFVLQESLGKVVIRNDVSETIIREVIDSIREK